MSRAVFLDRDGVLNQAIVRDGVPHPPQTVGELSLLPGVADACRDLKQAGFLLVVVTNQPDVARGTQSRSVVEEINGRLGSLLPLDAIRVCYHDDRDRCACRKPQPGLIISAAREFGIDPAESFMVGDRWRDIGAGRAAGCRTIYIDWGHPEPPRATPDHVAPTLGEAAAWILAQARGSRSPADSRRIEPDGTRQERNT